MVGLGAFCGLALSIASRIFYVYEDPRLELVQDCLAGANCGGYGYAGCSAAAKAVVTGKAPANVCIVAGEEAAIKENERCLNCCRICYTADVNPLVNIQISMPEVAGLN